MPRELAEDLRRFLGGQLVASHHYTIGVRIMRWLRKHRAAVAAVAIALTALIVLGTIMVRRILAERTRAQAAAVRELERSEDLIVAQANSYLETNPTLAASSLQQLPPESKWWPRLDATVADIRARGVAYALEIPTGMVTGAEAAPGDGERFLVSGYGGVMLYDVVRRTATSISSDKHVPYGQWASSDLVVVKHKTGDELVVPATDARTPAPWGTSVDVTTDRARTIVVIDAAGALTGYAVTGALVGPAVQLAPLPTPANGVKLSPSGVWLGVSSKTAAYLLKRRGAELAFDIVLTFEGDINVFAFEPGDQRAAVVSGGLLQEINLATGTTGARWNVNVGLPLFAGGDLYAWSMGGARRVGTQPVAPRLDTRGRSRLIEIAGAIARVELDGNIEIMSGGARYRLHPPYPVDFISAKPGGKFLIGTTRSKLLVWNISEIVATRSKIPAVEGLAFASPDDLRATATFRPIETPGGPRTPFYRYAIEPDRLTVRPDGVAQLPIGASIGIATDGTIIMDNRLADQWGTIEPVGVQIVGIPAITGVSILDSSSLVVASASGEIHRVDRTFSSIRRPSSHSPVKSSSASRAP